MARLKDIANISSKLEDVDFWLCFKGSEKYLGRVAKNKPEPTTSWVGVKVKEEYLDRVFPDYLYYVMMHLYNSGFYIGLGSGSLELKNLKIEDIGSKIDFDLPPVINKTSRRIILKSIFKKAKQYWGSQGAGILFICKEDNTCLLGLRSASVNEPGTWGVPGGAVEEGESPEVGAKREVEEEFGSLPSVYEKITQTKFEKDNFSYTTFVFNISKEEKKNWTKTIRLNWENDRIKWFDFSTLPTNLHFGVLKLKELLIEQSDLFLFPERKNTLDYYRNFLNEIKVSLKKENKQKLDSLIQEMSDELESENREDRVLKLISMAEKMEILSNELSSLNEDIAAQKIKVAAQRIRRDLNRDALEQDLVSQEQKLEKFLYHGTTFGDTLSILKTKSFHATGTYKKVSFTTNFDLALKFGDTVLAFDAEKLKAKGARKMNYGTDQEIVAASSEGRDEDSLDHPDGPIISNIYRYEQEWSVKTPFSFELNDLDRIYFICDPSKKYGGESNSYEEAMELVHEIVGDDVPLVCSNIKASAPFYPTFSSRVSSGVVGLKSFFFKNISGSFSDLKDLRDKYIDLFQKYNVSYHDYYRNNLSTYLHNLISAFSDLNMIRQNLESSYGKKELNYADAVNKIYTIISRLVGTSHFPEEDKDFGEVKPFDYREYDFYFFPQEAQGEIKELVDETNALVVKLLNTLKDEVSYFKNISKESLNLNKEESVYNLIFRSSFTYLPPFITNELNKKASDLFEKIYNDYKAGNLTAYGDEYKIKSRITDLAMHVSPSAIPYELLKDQPIILIDHKNPEQFTEQQIIEALSGQENYNADWVFKYRLRIVGEDIFLNQEKALQDLKNQAKEYPEIVKEIYKKIENSHFFIKTFKLLNRQDLLEKIEAVKAALQEVEKEQLVTAREQKINQLLKIAKAARN